MLLEAVTRYDISRYVADLFGVYIVLILIYVLATLVFAFGLRPPYSLAFDRVMGFLRDVSEPWLRIFRRLIPGFGGLDLSPMIAIIVLLILDRVITNLING